MALLQTAAVNSPLLVGNPMNPTIDRALGGPAACCPRSSPAWGEAKGGWGKSRQAFERGLAALAQYVARKGGLPARSVVGVLPDGADHRTGIWYGNLKARRDKLGQAQLAALAELGAARAR